MKDYTEEQRKFLGQTLPLFKSIEKTFNKVGLSIRIVVDILEEKKDGERNENGSEVQPDSSSFLEDKN